VTEVVAFEKFWPASDYHQNFVRFHPDQNYVRVVSLPRIRETLGE
jgi:peptide-methionine (S)-S-oxide reductase